MVKGNFNGLMENCTMDNGKITLNMEVGCGKDKDHPILDNGIMVLFLVLESSPIAKARDIKDNSITSVSKEKVPISLKMHNCTLECSIRISLMEKESIIGKMVITIREISSMDYGMDMV